MFSNPLLEFEEAAPQFLFADRVQEVFAQPLALPKESTQLSHRRKRKMFMGLFPGLTGQDVSQYKSHQISQCKSAALQIYIYTVYIYVKYWEHIQVLICK